MQLHEYCNPLNLEYVSDSPDTPYCCCNSDDCESSINSFTTMRCSTQCIVRITVCLRRQGSGDSDTSTTEKCYKSEVFNAPPKYKLAMKAANSVFPNFTEVPSEIVFNMENLTPVSLYKNMLTISYRYRNVYIEIRVRTVTISIVFGAM